MTYQNKTDTEWAQLIANAEKSISVATTNYPYPEVGSAAFNRTIDHALLKLDATPSQFETLCAEARAEQFATVCVRPEHVKQCVALLQGTDIRVASVIGFHEGTYDTAHKLRETSLSLTSGASELDIVLNHPLLLSTSYCQIFQELLTLRSSAPPPTQLKLILEISRLTSSRTHLVAGCVLAAAAGFDFVKTSTGFDGEGAREGDVRVMRAVCEWWEEKMGGREVRVKASGGVRTLGQAVGMLGAGARRLGTSAGVGIVREGRGGGREGGKREGGY